MSSPIFLQTSPNKAATAAAATTGREVYSTNTPEPPNRVDRARFTPHARLAGGSLDRAVVQLPAWQRSVPDRGRPTAGQTSAGAPHYTRFPGSARRSSAWRPRRGMSPVGATPGSAGIPLVAGAVLSIGHVLASFRAAPNMLRLRRARGRSAGSQAPTCRLRALACRAGRAAGSGFRCEPMVARGAPGRGRMTGSGSRRSLRVWGPKSRIGSTSVGTDGVG